MKRHALTLILFVLLALLPSGLRAEEALTKIEPLTIATDGDATMFTVEIADTDLTRERGLMFRQRLPEGHGMLFDFGDPRPVSMWMKNTLIPLDMLFIRADGTIAYIAENTVPKSLDTIGITEPVKAVLELPGGTARKKDIRSGDVVYHRLFSNAEEPGAPSP
ncbi:DUF192 domain-containing protein [Aestuariivirga sp.]|uniref:DUF192 domain-containing protein n=1 Tax=Aestuariivirga sp. TaxID=2650926 RepID=UPI0035B0D273